MMVAAWLALGLVWLWLACMAGAALFLSRVARRWDHRLRCRRVWRQAQRILIVADEKRRTRQ